jgi:hypothetical protein
MARPSIFLGKKQAKGTRHLMSSAVLGSKLGRVQDLIFNSLCQAIYALRPSREIHPPAESLREILEITVGTRHDLGRCLSARCNG